MRHSYTGKLSGWDQVRRVVWVDDVTGHGTEGRCAALGEPEQPANPQVFETIEFNGKDLVDLRLIDDKKEEEQPAAKPRGVDPIAQTGVSLTFPYAFTKGHKYFRSNQLPSLASRMVTS